MNKCKYCVATKKVHLNTARDIYWSIWGRFCGARFGSISVTTGRDPVSVWLKRLSKGKPPLLYTHTHTHKWPIFRHTNKLKHWKRLHTDTHSLSAFAYTPLQIHRNLLYRSLRSSFLPTSYCLLLSTDEQAPASVAKGTGLNQMKPTGTEWHSHASVATDEPTHTHAFIHKQKNCKTAHMLKKRSIHTDVRWHNTQLTHNATQWNRNIMYNKLYQKTGNNKKL